MTAPFGRVLSEFGRLISGWFSAGVVGGSADGTIPPTGITAEALATADAGVPGSIRPGVSTDMEAIRAAALLHFLAGDAWHDVDAGLAAFANGWGNYDTSLYRAAGFRKSGLGQVEFKGVIGGGTVPAAVFTLPEGYRPARTVLLVVLEGTNAAGKLEILPTGEVSVLAGDNTFVSLDGLSFDSTTF